MKDQLRIFDVALVFSANTMIRTYFEEVSKYIFIMHNRLDQREDCLKLIEFRTHLQHLFDKYIEGFDQQDKNRKTDIGTFDQESNKWDNYMPVLTKMAHMCDEKRFPLDESGDLEGEEKEQGYEITMDDLRNMIISLSNTVNSNIDRFIESPDIFLPSVARDAKNREGWLIHDSIVLHKSTVDKMIQKYLGGDKISFADLQRIKDIFIYHRSLVIQVTLLRSMRLNQSTTSKRE